MDEILATEYKAQGEVLLGNGKHEYSLQYFQKAEKENPFNPGVYIGMGIAYTNLAQYGPAEDAFFKALKVNGEAGEIYYHLGNISFIKSEKVRGIQTPSGIYCLQSAYYRTYAGLHQYNL